MADTLHNAPIVLDNGSGTIRAGFAGEDQPKCYFPSYVGRPKHTRILAGALEGDVFIGPRAQELRGLLKIRYPLEHGIVTDWDDMEKIWQFVYTEELKTLSEEVCQLLTQGGIGISVIATASRSPHGTAAEPSSQPGHRCPASLRNIQYSRALHLYPSSPFPLRFGTNDWCRSRRWRWRFPRRTSLRRIRYAQQHPKDRCCGTRRHRANATAIQKRRYGFPYQRGKRGGKDD